MNTWSWEDALKERRRSWQETTLGEYLRQIEEDMMKASGGGDPVVSQWSYIVGDVMKDDVSLESIDEGSMTVRCTHPAFANYFRMHQNEVLSRLEDRFPDYDIRNVKVLT